MSEEKRFYLTFDGAPNPPGTDRILEKLAAHGVPATFFMEGQRVDGEPECAKRVLRAGHAIGNHSYTHPDFSTLSLEACDAEIEKTQQALQRHLRLKPRLLRPPFGKIKDEVIRHFEQQGFTIVLWDYSIKDWEGPDAAAIAQRVLSQLREGAAIVMHDKVEWNPEVIDLIVPEIRKMGYTFCAKT